MGRKNSIDKDLAALDELIGGITTDAYGDDEQLWAFRQAIENDVTLPADGFVIGEPVSIVEIDYGGNTRRGLTAKCRREDGSVHVVAASEVTFPEGSVGGRYIAAYRRWLGLDPSPGEAQPSTHRKRRHKAADDDLASHGNKFLSIIANTGADISGDGKLHLSEIRYILPKAGVMRRLIDRS
jgi:hypothetical protein